MESRSVKSFGSGKSIAEIRDELLSGAKGLAGSVRRLVRWRATLHFGALFLAAVWLLLVADIVLRREEFGLRLLSLGALIAVALATARWLLRPAWQFSPTPVQVAKCLEQRRPECSEQLSTMVELAGLPIDETRYGSSGFRESALRRWDALGQTPNWHEYLERRSVVRAASALGLVVLAFGVLATVWPNESVMAMKRLAMPWSLQHWPRVDQLALRDLPAAVAVGTELQIEVVDLKPPLPERVELQYRFVESRGSATITNLATTRVGELAVGNLPALQSAVDVRAVGGDDDLMPWSRIDVVKPPELTDYHFTIQPPAYSRRPATELVGRRLRVLQGSRVGFNAVFSEAVAQVDVDMQPAPPVEDSLASPSDAQPVAQQIWRPELSDDGRQLRLKNADGELLLLNRSLVWQLSITTRDGLKLQQPELWSIEVVQDTPPLVSLRTAEMSELSVDARLPLVGQASDDLGLVEVVARLQIEGTDVTAASRFPIWKSQPPVESQTDETFSGSGSSLQSTLTELTVDTSWPFASDLPVTVGQRIVVWLEATDTRGQIGLSHKQSFEIRDPGDLLAAIENRQRQVLDRVRELVESQRRNHQLTARTAEAVKAASKVAEEQIDVFESIAQLEQAIGKQLAGDPASVAFEVAKLAEFLKQNRLEQSELAEELQVIRTEIERIARGGVRAATEDSQKLVSAAQVAAADSSVDRELHNAMDQSTASQSKALSELQSLMDRLARNESLQQVQRELAQILNQQNALRRETDQLQLEQLSNPNPVELAARRAALAADQQGLARRLDELVQRARDLNAAASGDQQSLKAQIEAATAALEGGQVSSEMRRSSQELSDEQYAQSATTQQKISDLLNDALRKLGASRNSQFGSLQGQADNLSESAESLRQLASEQAALADRMQAEDVLQNEQSLLDQQSELRKQSGLAAENAERSGDPRTTAGIESAMRSQELAEQQLRQQSGAQAAEAARQAAEQLRNTADNLAERAAAMQREVTQQQLFELAAAVAQLVEQQIPVVAQWQRLADATPPPAATEVDLEQRQTQIRQNASRQEAVRQMLRDVRTQTTRLPTFDWTFERIEQAMTKSVAAAQRYRIEPEARQASAEALRLLELAVQAIESDPNKNDGNPDENGEVQETQPAASRPLPALASLKLLRSLQSDINQQTLQVQTEADAVRRAQRLSELSAMQQALGEQLTQMLREIAAANDTGDGP